ncbi:MAG: hypothetical protein ACPGMR_10570 [Pontibacterium sp.]
MQLTSLRRILSFALALTMSLTASAANAYQFSHPDLPIKITQERIGEAMRFGPFTVTTFGYFRPELSGNVGFDHTDVNYHGELVLRFESDMGNGDDDPKTKSGDMMIFRGACKDDDAVSLVFSESFMGSANGSTPDTLFFISEDSSSQTAFVTEHHLGYLSKLDCLESANEDLARSKAAKIKEDELFELFTQGMPATAAQIKPEHFAPKALPTPDAFINVISLLEPFNRYYGEPEFCSISNDDNYHALNCFRAETGISQVFDSVHFSVHRFKIVRASNSRGFDVVYDKTNNRAFTLYHIPSGSHRVFLYVPEYLSSTATSLTAKFCEKCSGFGEYGTYRVGLEKGSIERLDD